MLYSTWPTNSHPSDPNFARAIDIGSPLEPPSKVSNRRPAAVMNAMVADEELRLESQATPTMAQYSHFRASRDLVV